MGGRTSRAAAAAPQPVPVAKGGAVESHMGWDEADREVIRLLGSAIGAATARVKDAWAAVREEADLQQALWASSAPASTAAKHGTDALFAALREGISRKDVGLVSHALSLRVASAVGDERPGQLSTAQLRVAGDALAEAEQNLFIWRQLNAGVKNSDRLEIEAWMDGVDDSSGGIAAQAAAGARRFRDRLIDRERRALERLESQQALYEQVSFGVNTLDLELLVGLVSHAEANGLDSTPARLAMQEVRRKVQEKDRSEADVAAAAAAQAAELEWEQELADKQAREAQESADAAFAIAEQRRLRKQERQAEARRTKESNGRQTVGGGGGAHMFADRRARAPGDEEGSSDDDAGISVEEAYARVERERRIHERGSRTAFEQQARENARRYAKQEDRLHRKQDKQQGGGYEPGVQYHEPQPHGWAGLKRDNEPREWVDGHTAEEMARRRAQAKAKRDAEERTRQQQREQAADKAKRQQEEREQRQRHQQQQQRRQQQHQGGGRHRDGGATSGGLSTAGALELLELPAGGGLPSSESIRKAYRKAALKWHPDRPHNHANPCVFATDRSIGYDVDSFPYCCSVSV